MYWWNAECPACQSVQAVKNGRAKNGTQTYLCKVCGRRFHPEAQPVAHSEATQKQVLDAVHERISLRGVQRVFGVHHNTVTRWIKVDKKGAAEVRQTAAVCLTSPEELVVEMDELWTFVGKKEQARWLWIALERRTGRVLAWVLGDRSETTAFKLWDRLPLSPLQRLKGTFCTDL